jgi:starch synthase
MDKAIKTFRDKKKWLEMIENAMQSNFSWKESAKRYLELYEKAKLL